MKHTLLILLFLCSFSGYTQETNLTKQTHYVIDLLKQKEYERVYALFSPNLKRQISVSEVEMTWEDMLEKYDSLTEVQEPAISRKDTLWLSETRIAFTKKAFMFQLSFSGNGMVCGLFFRNTLVPYSPPAYINTLSFYELKLNIAAKGISNEGVLSLPKNNANPPLVIIVGGSGPTNMDAGSGTNKPYKDLAWALASQGIAVYRYNKRTFNKANIDTARVAHFGLKEEYGDDLKALVRYFRKSDKINTKQIYIMGHSQGGFMLPYFARENGKKIKGYISLAGNVSTIADALPYQFRYLKELNPDTAVAKAFDAFIARADYMQRHVASAEVNNDSMIQGMTLYYMKDMEKNQPKKLAQYLMNKPVLVIQGGRDYQVPPTEAELWKGLLKEACCTEFKTFDKLNHLMMEGEGKPGPSEYSKPNNVPEYVPQFIAAWILNRNK